jgi:TorA maturation chaperone TorD
MPLGRLASVREASYRLVSQAFLYPDESRLQGAGLLATELGREEASLARFAFFSEWSRLLHSIRGLGSKDGQNVQNEFVSLFVASADDVPCPPYESVYREPGGRPTGRALAEIEREYTTVGLALSPSFKEFPDHVSLQTEFMAILCERESLAWEDQDLKRGLRIVQKEKAFLDRHLALWFPQFARRIRIADSTGIYAAIGAGAEWFISHDNDLLGELIATLSEGSRSASS